MPRSSSKSGSRSISSSSPTINKSNQPAPYIPSIQVAQPTMFQSAIQGFGLGMGSSIARNIFEHKQPVIQYPTPVAPESAQKTYELKKFEFKKCMENTNDYDTCVHHLE